MLRRVFLTQLLWLTLAACGAEPPDKTPAVQARAEAPGDIVERVGDITVHCSVVQTSMLPDAIARQYGVERSAHTVLLLVVVLKGDPAVATAVPATVSAMATDLVGDRQALQMREVRSGDLIDSIGTLHTTLPDTLRFEVTVRTGVAGPVHLQFQRDLYPQ